MSVLARISRTEFFTKASVSTFLLALSMFCTGASGIVAEFVLGTVSSYILGNAVEQFSVTFGVMLFAMGVGGYIQRHFSDVNLIQRFVLLEIILAILIGFGPLAIYAAYATMSFHFYLVQYFFMVAIGLLVGFEIPLITRINNDFLKLKENLAAIFSMDYIGAFAGTIVWVYVLLQHFPLTEIGFIVAGLNLFVAVITYAFFKVSGELKHTAKTSAALAFSIILLGVGYHYNRDWSMDLEQRLYDDQIVYSETSRYQHMVMTHYKSADDYRFYINGNLQFSSVDEMIYHEQLVHPAMEIADSRKRVLILGGGDGMALREVLKYSAVEHVTLVDLDPAMVELASTHPVLTRLNDSSFADARVHAKTSDAVEAGMEKQILHQVGVEGDSAKPKFESVAEVDVFSVDASRFLDKVNTNWDVVVVDLPDPNTIQLTKLYSRQFFRKLRGHLAPNGVIAQQATSPYHAKPAFLTIKRTAEAAGFATVPYHDNVPSFGEWGWLIYKDHHFTQPKDIKRKIRQIESFDVQTKYLNPKTAKAALVFGKGALQSDSAEVNTLMQPVLLEKYRQESWKIE
ncbi:MAG: spermidine synthase [Parcubacteria group bacterium SW_6_46_9]|nr:MAG: spermidine synthase [Parcubacteria group bacterium SW_6_46_9]